MATTTVLVHLVPGTPRPGLWCDVCALPSKFEVDVYGLSDHSTGPLVLGTWAMCTEHDQPDDH